MAKELLKFKGLFGEHVTPFGKFDIHHEPLLTRSVMYDFEILQHLHTDLVQVFFLTSGGGFLLNSGRKIKLESPCALIIPSNTLHGFAFQSEVKGDVFTVSDWEFDSFLKQGQPFFSSFDQLSLFYFTSASSEYLELLKIKDQIIEEIAGKDLSTSFGLSLLFQLLLLRLYRSQKGETQEGLEVDNKTLHHFQSFKRLLKKKIPEKRTVKFYAEEMTISPVHLNRICQAMAKQTALQCIHEQILFEARKFLSGSSYSISEIAYFLGFSDPAHFSKFFKKKGGITALAFRKGLGSRK